MEYWAFLKEYLLFIFVLLYIVCIDVRMEILVKRLIVHVCDVLASIKICRDGMYTCKTGYFWKQDFVFMVVLL